MLVTAKDCSVRILIVDDSELMRRGLCSLLQSHAGWVVCGEAADGNDIVRKAADLRPDVILVDVSMPYLNGFEAARAIHEQVPEAEILLVTEHDSRMLATLPSQPGVRGYVAKSRIDFDLIPAVEAALANPKAKSAKFFGIKIIPTTAGDYPQARRSK